MLLVSCPSSPRRKLGSAKNGYSQRFSLPRLFCFPCQVTKIGDCTHFLRPRTFTTDCSTKLADPGDVAHAFSVLCRAFDPDISESIVNLSPVHYATLERSRLTTLCNRKSTAGTSLCTQVREIRRCGKRIALGLEDDPWLLLHLMVAGDCTGETRARSLRKAVSQLRHADPTHPRGK